MKQTVLEVKNLTTRFYTPGGIVEAVNCISFSLSKGQTLGIVGESGCGKSVTALSLMGLINPPGRIAAGEVWLDGQNLLTLSRRQLRSVRGHKISMIFQDPVSSLNPIFTIGRQLTETIHAHRHLPRACARAKARELLERVGLHNSNNYFNRYPFQLSGGQCQRAMIALGLALAPGILIADEPTTALDVTIQAQILFELKQLQQDFNTAIILITHSLAVVAENADEVAVMYAGQIVESGPVETVFTQPAHPYTEALLHALPSLDNGNSDLRPIDGHPPQLTSLPLSCTFAPRCRYANSRCQQKAPSLQTLADGRLVACHHAAYREHEVVNV